MPPPSSPQSSGSSTGSDSVNEGVSSDATNLNTINILSNLLLRNNGESLDPTGDQRRARGIRPSENPNRHSSVYNNELRIQNHAIPMQIRNIDRTPFARQRDTNEDDDFDDEADEDFDELHGNFDDESDDLDDELSSEPDNLRSDIQSNERLLLSSARQNHTNTNTLIPGSNEGIPLRRQNAIRFRSRLTEGIDPRSGNMHEKADKLRKKEAKELYGDLSSTLKIIKRLRLYPGTSKIFSRHSKHHENCFQSGGSDDLLGNLDSVLDSFLSSRTSGRLWLESNHDFKRNVKQNDKSIATHKRKWSSDDLQPENKRRKPETTKHTPSATSKMTSKSMNNSVPGLTNLSYKQRHSIMDVTYSSFLKSGSSFSLRTTNEDVTADPMDLVFSSVNYKTKTLQGVFSIAPDTSKYKEITSFASRASQMLDDYQEFFLGLNRETDSGPRDKLVAKQLKIIRCLDSEESILPSTIDVIKPFTIPVAGKIVDFKNNDLRFLPLIKEKDNLPMRCLHLARTKSNRVRLQLLEWMKIQPFVQFEEQFFLEHLSKARDNLKTFKNQNSIMQKETIDLSIGIRNSMYDLTKDFDFIKARDIPIPYIENERFKRQMSFTEYKKSFFLQDWEKKLTNRLVRFVTCQDQCLLNVQLNYILFTLSIDLCEFLDNYIEFKLNYVSNEVRNRYKKQLSKKGSYTLSDTKKTILLCSLNRKTGHIEIQNTRALLDYKNAYQFDTHVDSRSRNMNQDEDSLFHGFFNGLLNESPPPESTAGDSDFLSDENDERIEWEDPYHEADLETILKGRFKQINQGNISFGGGSSSYSIV